MPGVFKYGERTQKKGQTEQAHSAPKVGGGTNNPRRFPINFTPFIPMFSVPYYNVLGYPQLQALGSGRILHRPLLFTIPLQDLRLHVMSMVCPSEIASTSSTSGGVPTELGFPHITYAMFPW